MSKRFRIGCLTLACSVVGTGIWAHLIREINPTSEDSRNGRAPVATEQRLLREIRLAPLLPERSRTRDSVKRYIESPKLDPAELQRMLRAVTVTDVDIAEYHRSNSAVFGDRPVAECRSSIEKLIRYERVLRELEGR